MPLPAPAPPAASRVTLREFIGYGLGDTASNLFFQTFGIFLVYYYVDVWGIAAGSVATMMVVVRLIDACTDPAMGLIADRTTTRWGKFRPYLLWMAIPYGVCGYLLFANPDLQGNGKLVYAYVTYSLMMLAYTAINVPYSSLLGVISPSPRIRSLASTFRFVGAFGGGFLISLLARPLVRELGGEDEVLGFQKTMAIFAVASVLLWWVSFATTRERVIPPKNQKTDVRAELGELVRNRPWVVLLFAAVFSTTFIAMRSGSTLFYFKYNVGNDGIPILFDRFDRGDIFLSSSMLFMMLGTACVGVIAGVADKRLLAVLLTSITAVCYASFYFLPTDNFTLLMLVNGVGTFCMGPTSALVWAMYGDVADFGEWKFGRRSTGLVYSASLFALKTGSMIAGFLVPVFLARFGYVSDAVQSERALLGILLAFSVMPGLFAGLKALMLWIYPLTEKQVRAIAADLEARKAAAEA